MPDWALENVSFRAVSENNVLTFNNVGVYAVSRSELLMIVGFFGLGFVTYGLRNQL